MDLRKLKTLIDLVSESNVSELEITEAEGKVRIVKSEGVVHQQYVAAPMQAGAEPTTTSRHRVFVLAPSFLWHRHAAPLKPNTNLVGKTQLPKLGHCRWKHQ